MPGPNLLPDRLLIAGAVVLTCVLFTRAALDPVNVIKLTALLVVAVALVAVSLGRVIKRREMRLPMSAAGAVAVALTVAFTVSAVTAPMASTAIYGTYGRNSGLLAYLAALVLYFAALRSCGGRHGQAIVGVVVVAALFTATYGLLQKLGLDAIPWNNPFNPIIAALGNPNFASGYLGIGAAVAAGGALYSGWHFGWRAVSSLTAALCLLAAALSASVQGPIAAGGGLLIVGTAFALNQTVRLRCALLVALGSGALSAVGVLLLGAIAKAGPAAAIFSDVGSEARTYYWGAALQMFRGELLLGVGLDHYGAFWRSSRSSESIAALGGPQFSDAAHSVPLQMLAQGGLLLGLTYAGFVIVALVALIRGLLRMQGEDRILLGALGGGWAAYQVQSTVSIDQVPLIVLHFVLAGTMIAAAGAAGLREIRLPGAPTPAQIHANDARTKRRVSAAAAQRDRELTGADVVMLSIVGLVAFAAAWQSLTPLRANLAALDGDQALARGDGSGAVTAYDRATELLPGQGVYWIKKGQFFERLSPPQASQAMTAYLHGVEKDPYDARIARAAAGLAEKQGDLDRSRRLYRQAVDVDPLNPETVVDAATFELRHSGASDARQLLDAVVQQVPGSASLWATLGDARAVLGDTSAARDAYAQALTLEPDQETAARGLANLEAEE